MTVQAVVLLSGGVDSCVTLAYALDQGVVCRALSFDYGQRHIRELDSARAIAQHYSVQHTVARIDPILFSRAANSALTDPRLPIEAGTYVPCRNLLFLAHAASFVESTGAVEMYFGAHAQDYPSYPDCQARFFSALERAIQLGSNAKNIRIKTPLLQLEKAQVIELGLKLQAPLQCTWSCYDPKNSRPCGVCPACQLRASLLDTETPVPWRRG